MVIFRESNLATRSGDFKRRICNTMDAWESGKIEMLVQDTHSSTRAATAQLSKMQGMEMEEQRGKTFARLVLQGKLGSVVGYLTKQEKGG